MLRRRQALAMPALLPGLALAQTWPDRQVTVVVPWAAGGSTDFLARLLAQRLSESLGQPFVVDNRPGGSGTVGHLSVARARPDGLTLLVGANGTYSMAPHMMDLPYDNNAAFAPVGVLGRSPIFFCANPRGAAADMAGLIAQARARPGEVAYASSGVGSSAHLAAELFAIMAGVELLHVPYRGGGPAAQALIAGEIAFGPTDAPTALPLMRANSVKALGVGNAARSPQAPEVATIAEQHPSLAGFECASEFALLAPAATPAPIIARLSEAMRAAMAHPTLLARLTEGGMEATPGTPAEWPAYLARENDKWGRVIRARGIRAG